MAIERMLSEELPSRVLVARVLAEAGIEYVFGISGGHTGRIISGLRRCQSQVRMVTVREELLAGVMAEVYGRLTRRPGVMIGQGPWVLGNGLIGTLEAYLSSSPMVLLTDFSDAPHFQLHAPYQQATGDYGSWDARRAFGGVTKQVMQAHEPLAAVQATQLAIKHAMAGQPGPVAVLFSARLAGRQCRARLAARAVPDPLLSAAAAAAGRTGAGEAAAERMLAARATRSSSPATACASRRPTSVARTGRAAGHAGRRPPPPARAPSPRRIRWRSACSAPSARRRRTPVWARPTWCWWSARNWRQATPRAKTRSCSTGPAELHPDRHRAEETRRGTSRRARGARRRRADTAAAAEAVGRAAEAAATAPSGGSRGTASEHGYSTSRLPSDEAPLLPQRVIGDDAQPAATRDRHLRRRREPHPDDALLPDQGGRRVSAGGRLRRRWGSRIPAALGAKLVYPDRPVVAVCGDGGFAMTMNALMTAIEQDIPIVSSCSTTTRSAGCCTAPGRSPPSSRISTCRDRPRDGLPRQRVEEPAASARRCRRRWRATPDGHRRADRVEVASPTSPHP